MEIFTRDTSKSVIVNDDIFLSAYNEGLIHQTIVAFLNNMRSGNSAQKTRAEVRGGGKKPWKQKGTGRARAGSIRSPIWRGGGVTFASKKRDFSQKLNKKMYKKALCSIVAELHRAGRLIVVSDFNCETHKTKEFVIKMQSLNLNNALVITENIGENEYLASRNLYSYAVCDVSLIDPVNLLKFENVLITVQAMQDFERILQ